MSTLTTRYGFKKPDGDDLVTLGVDEEVDVLSDNYDLADEWLPNKPITGVPGSSTPGRVHWDRVNRRLMLWNGSVMRNIGGRRPSCLARRTTNIDPGSGGQAVGYYLVNFEEEVWDTNNFWNSGNPSRITFVEAGLYRVEYSIGYGPNGQANPDVDIVIPLNGSTSLWHWRGPSGAAISPLTGHCQMGACRLLLANANDYLQFRLATNHPNGVVVGTYGGGDNVATYCKVMKLS